MSFTPPTADEVKAYAREIGYVLDVDRFMSFYEMSGWRIAGKAKMKDWKAAVRFWRSNENARMSMPRPASLGSLQVQLGKVEDEIRDILYPGGCAYSRTPEGAIKTRHEGLVKLRTHLKRLIEDTK